MPAFLNCTSESLIDDLVKILPPDKTVLEILETLEPTSTLLAACRKLKAAGFRLALDDFAWEPKFQPLMELANYIKVDFRLTEHAERKSLIKRVRGLKVTMLAEKIETQEEYAQACKEGFTLFQGFYFCRPVLLKNRKIPSNRLSQIEILELMQADSIDIIKLPRLVKRDASLTYRLLRMVNSPAYAIRDQVRSIHEALLLVGEKAFRRIATLAITSDFGDGQPTEVLRMAFVRGRFCELAAGLCRLDPTEQYLLGMLSLLPAMLRLPMDEVAPMLPLRDEIRSALRGNSNSERCLLQWLENHEQGNWAGCDALVHAYRLDEDKLIACYADALVWAEAALTFAA